MEDKLRSLSLTARHFDLLESTLEGLLGKSWSLDTPVFLFNRCWLRLEKVKLKQLGKRLPADNSAEAPELIKYNQLLAQGHDHLLAVQECWSEFGIDDFHRAIRNYWYWQDIGNHGWTFKIYLELLSQYKKSFSRSSIVIPLIILGRQNSIENHVIEWITKTESQKITSIVSK